MDSIPARSTCQARSQSASASSSLLVVPNFRVSCCRPPLRVSLGTRIVTMTSALPMSIPATRSQNSGSFSTSSIVISYDDSAVNGRGRPQELGASGNLIRGLEAPVHSPQEQLPAHRLFNGVRPATIQRRQRTAAAILHPQPPRRDGNRACTPGPAAKRQQPQPAADPHPAQFSRRTASRRAPATIQQASAACCDAGGDGELSRGFEGGWHPGVAVEQVAERAELADVPFLGGGRAGLGERQVSEPSEGAPASS